VVYIKCVGCLKSRRYSRSLSVVQNIFLYVVSNILISVV
jgi:hypothetical protein